MTTSDFSKISSYGEIIIESRRSIAFLNSIRIIIPSDSWIQEALSHAELVDQNHKKGSLEEFLTEDSIRWKTTVCLGTLSEFNFVMSQAQRMATTNMQVLKKKINEIMNMPLMVADENSQSGTNLGRNTLFELRLAARFSQAGFNPTLFPEHPDILIQTPEHEYAVECKRVFSSKSFKSLTRDAINQLQKYSLKDQSSRLGIVAISISRNFHMGVKKISISSENSLGRFADRITEDFIREHADFIQETFPSIVPAIILDFSDLAEGERPYWVHWIYLVGTGDGSEPDNIKFVKKDLRDFLEPKLKKIQRSSSTV